MIGTTAALLGSAVIGGIASGVGAASNNSAINNATDAQTRLGQQSLALQQQNKDYSNALLTPYANRGNAAGESINALLGLPSAGGSAQPSGQPDYAGYVAANPDLQAEFARVGSQFGYDPAAYGQFHWSAYGQREGRQLPGSQATASGTTPVNAQNAFDNYLNSAGYKFQLGEANKGANAQFAAAGALDSGAAVKAAQDRAQNIGTSFFNNYLNLLGGQQQTGLAGASAVAGVGQNFANNATNINTNMGNAISNGAMAKAGNTNSLLGNLSSSFGLGLGALSGFGGVPSSSSKGFGLGFNAANGWALS